MNLKIKLLNENATLPQYAHETDSGMDLFTSEEMIIPSHKAIAIGTGLAFNIPQGHEIQVRPKSGISLNGCKKCKLFVVSEYGNSWIEKPCYISVRLGTVDQGFTGEVKIIVYNEEDYDVLVPQGTKLAQAVLTPIARANIEVVKELNNTDRGGNGFGSTGI